MTDAKLKPIIDYHDDGTIKRAYSVDENGKYDGPYEAYWSNGRLNVKCTYKDGKEDGPYETYHENGQLRIKCTYKDGKKDGPYEWYDENGRLGLKCTYKDGELDGPYESYHDNGQLRVKYTYKDNEPDGPYEEYDENGQLIEKGVYRMGGILYGKEAEEYLKEWNEKHITAQEARKGLCARLAQMSKQMAPTQLRQAVKRAEVAKFRAKFPNKKDGR